MCDQSCWMSEGNGFKTVLEFPRDRVLPAATTAPTVLRASSAASGLVGVLLESRISSRLAFKQRGGTFISSSVQARRSHGMYAMIMELPSTQK